MTSRAKRTRGRQRSCPRRPRSLPPPSRIPPEARPRGGCGGQADPGSSRGGTSPVPPGRRSRPRPVTAGPGRPRDAGQAVRSLARPAGRQGTPRIAGQGRRCRLLEEPPRDLRSHAESPGVHRGVDERFRHAPGPLIAGHELRDTREALDHLAVRCLGGPAQPRVRGAAKPVAVKRLKPWRDRHPPAGQEFPREDGPRTCLYQCGRHEAGRAQEVRPPRHPR
jgi:hypothetical protein